MVQADGKPITGPGRERLVMFQEPALFPWLNVFGNVLFGLKLKPNLTNQDQQDVAKSSFELVGLSRFERGNIHELSGGMKQPSRWLARWRLIPRAPDGRAVCCSRCADS